MQATDNISEKFRDLCLLTAILVVAAGARFYCLDQNALATGELSNLLVCDARGWLEMVARYTGNSGMPPVYPTLLCQFTDWTSNAEFLVRALSAAAGIASVYMTYLFGRYFLSSTTGLLAAAALATNLQLVLLDRTATLYPVLMLFMLVHSYCFCRLLVVCDSTASRNIAVNLTGDRWGIQWHWQPGFSCDARFLLGFWISGALAFYTSTIALILLVTELAASFFLVGRGKRLMVLRLLWIPLLVAMLPWVPSLYERKQWALHGNLFEVTGISTISLRLENFLPVSLATLKIQFMIVLASILAIGVTLARRQYAQVQKRFLLFSGAQLVIAVMAMWFIKASDPQSYFYFLCIAILIPAEAVAIGIRKIPSAALQSGMVVVIALIAMSVQSGINRKNKIYQKESFDGFELAARIIRDDKSFMGGNRTVFMTKPIFAYYLRKYGIYEENTSKPDEAVIDAANKALGNKEFYYLEYAAKDQDFSNDHPVFRQLSQSYKIQCLSKGGGFRITKFSSETPSAEGKVEECLAHLSKGATL